MRGDDLACCLPEQRRSVASTAANRRSRFGTGGIAAEPTFLRGAT
jgi:hypothetical protein